MNRQDIARKIRSRDPAERLAFLEDAPAVPAKSFARISIESANAGLQIVGWNTLLIPYVDGVAPRFGAELAVVLYDWALEIWSEGEGTEGLQLTTVSGLASLAATGFNACGAFGETVDFADRAGPELRAAGEARHSADLAAHAAEAALELGEVERAAGYLEHAEGSEHFERVAARLTEHRDALKAAVESVVDDLAEPGSAEPSTALGRIGALSDMLASAMPAAVAENQPFAMMMKLQSATQTMLASDQRYDPEGVERSLAAAREVFAWADVHHHVELRHGSLWIGALCCRRLERFEESVEMFETLRTMLEGLRSHTADPGERAGYLDLYPTLFDCLCEDLSRLDRPAALLEVIERANARPANELRTYRSGVPADEGEPVEAVAALPELLKSAQGHYLTYYAGEKATYGALMTAAGQVFTSGPIDHPRSFYEGDGSTVVDSVGGLVAWLEPLVEAGTLSEGDHLCVSADGVTRGLPAHRLPFRGAPLVRTFSVSTIPGAASLVSILRRPARRPSAAVGIVAPMEASTPAADDGSPFGSHADVVEWLAARPANVLASAHRLAGTEARWEQLTALPLTGALLHFAAPAVATTGEGGRVPYRHSGVWLAAEGPIPGVDDRVGPGAPPEPLLTPERLLDAAPDLTGAHVSLAAGVLGRAPDGARALALGLDWALLECGAASLLVTYGGNDRVGLARLVGDFYARWYHDGASRGQAWRASALLPWPEEVAEAAASVGLVGDWR